MGYACPVCETPQADAHHLANHLAFTALLGDDDHEAWLDEHTPGWDEAGEDELAERVLAEAKEVEVLLQRGRRTDEAEAGAPKSQTAGGQMSRAESL